MLAREKRLTDVFRNVAEQADESFEQLRNTDHNRYRNKITGK
jgi:hypothetical protein